jgi:RNA polymerase sigma-70 factor (ECF subfamily)
MILRLAAADEPARQKALSEMCEAYWKPLYAYARNLGATPEDAEDLTQGFIAHLLQNADFATLTAERGRMRSFFKTAFKNFTTDELRRKLAAKRAAQATTLSLDFAALEHELVCHQAPDAAFDQQWTRSLLARALAALQAKYANRGKAALLRELEPFLGDAGQPAYRELSTRLGHSEIALRAAVSRMREQYRDILRAEVAETLAPGEDVDTELRSLLAVASRAG